MPIHYLSESGDLYQAPEEPFLPPLGIESEVVIRLCLSMLFEAKGLSAFLQSMQHNFPENRLFHALGVERPPENEYENALERQLMARRAEVGRFDGDFGRQINTGISHLADRIGLSEIDCQILGFAALLELHRCLAKLSSLAFGELDALWVAKVTASTLGMEPSAVQAALSTRGILCRSGLLCVERKQSSRLHTMFSLMPSLAGALMAGAEEIDALLDRSTPKAPAAGLTLADYPHLRAEVSLARRLLAATRHPGTNLLFHGPPGTGKTQLARALADVLERPLYQVPNEDDDDGPVTGSNRLRSFRLAQNVLARQPRALILFDEVEDVFPDRLGVSLGNSELTKGWMNDTLESNPVPTIWVCNGLSGFDEAYLRRFSQVVEVGLPPQPVRERMIRAHTRSLPVSRAWCQRASRHPHLSPALLRQAVDTLSRAGYRQGGRVESTLETLLNASLGAMGEEILPKPGSADQLRFHLAYLNADHDLKTLVQGVKCDPRARLCLYGPPGTGKSAFGAHLAHHLRRPLLVRRASDLLNPYVGGTEQQLATMFREAETARAVLVLDEADSFLRDRREARASWELTQTNEFLTQLEAFDGLFVASTNLFDALDGAALRRFDLKIRFDYLRPEQSWRLFRETLRQAGGQLSKPEPWRTRLAAMDRLTPGDFAVQLRRNRLTAEPMTPVRLLHHLAAEMALKTDTPARAVGFMANL
ncbi:AAA family ATPase [Thiorhodovibrio frisius]|uniref:AAA family ATPase n=1 Tax=Thiorhodovibrio frisius TaxID=631362 RepID=UPI002B259C30|nr:ATP-binding protein [Thiorhodovibrio frisius]WPL22957.1 ATP-dependent zinc metalloprotease FtsH 1 [Thiorhodovibrio frisius]